jgi:hypothetical protein
MFQWGSFLQTNKQRHERSLGNGIEKSSMRPSTSGTTVATTKPSCLADLSSDSRDPCIKEVLNHINTIHLHLNPQPSQAERRRCSKVDQGEERSKLKKKK